MKITLTQSGGLAAGIRRAPNSVDSCRLPEKDQQELERLVATVKTEPSPAADAAVRDGLSYTISVEQEGSPVVLRQSDGAMTHAFAQLLDLLERCGHSDHGHDEPL